MLKFICRLEWVARLTSRRKLILLWLSAMNVRISEIEFGFVQTYEKIEGKLNVLIVRVF